LNLSFACSIIWNNISFEILFEISICSSWTITIDGGEMAARIFWICWNSSGQWRKAKKKVKLLDNFPLFWNFDGFSEASSSPSWLMRMI
jgi:hypothetical protein